MLDSSAPLVDAAAYRGAMSRFCNGVTVITASSGAGVHGMTATAFTSVSLHPPTILVCVGTQARMNAILASCGRFGVSILREDQAELAMHFAGRGITPSVVFESYAGVQVIEGAIAHVVCEVAAAYAGGDHTLFLGRVMACRANDGSPLLHYRGDYRRLHDRQATGESRSTQRSRRRRVSDGSSP